MMSERENKRARRMRELCESYVDSHDTYKHTWQSNPGEAEEEISEAAKNLVDFLAKEILEVLIAREYPYRD